MYLWSNFNSCNCSIWGSFRILYILNSGSVCALYLLILIILRYVEGRRRRGRPRKQYIDNIKQWTQLPTSQCVRAAEDRSGWKRLVSQAMMANDHTWSAEKKKKYPRHRSQDANCSVRCSKPTGEMFGILAGGKSCFNCVITSVIFCL